MSKKKILIHSRLEYDRILQAAQCGKGEIGLKTLCEEVRRSLLADNIVVLVPNPQGTLLTGTVNGSKITISARSTVLSVVFQTGEIISAKFGDLNFDPRIQQMLKMKVKAFQAGPLLNHIGEKIGLLLVIRKRPEMLFEKELSSLLSIFSLYIDRWKLLADCEVEREKAAKLVWTCGEILKSTSLHDFISKLQTNLPGIFHCERGNILMFDYEKNNLFRRVNATKYENFPIFHGLSGNCVNMKKSVICNEVNMERMFCKEMDDPEGENTRSVISLPLFSKIYPGIPEAVVQLINRVDGAYFTEEDEKTMTNFLELITECMIVLKFSQLSASLVEILKKLEESLERMTEDMSHRVYDIGSVHSSIVLFKTFFLKFLQ